MALIAHIPRQWCLAIERYEWDSAMVIMDWSRGGECVFLECCEHATRMARLVFFFKRWGARRKHPERIPDYGRCVWRSRDANPLE